jgi:hypothetical protein
MTAQSRKHAEESQLGRTGTAAVSTTLATCRQAFTRDVSRLSCRAA